MATRFPVTLCDWYDAFLLPDGGLALAVGDVTGHDHRAAAAARLQAALGQVILYAAASGDQQQFLPALDLHRTGEAVSGLGLAIMEMPPGAGYVSIGAEIVAWIRAALETLRDQLRVGAWAFCPCGERHGQDETDAQVLRAVQSDLLFLPPARTGALLT